MADLPDYYTQTSIAEAEAASFKGGLEANLPAEPVSRDIYLATDKQILYVCIADGFWTGFDAATLTQGILTLYANMLGGGFEIENIADPTAAQSAVTRNYLLAETERYLLLAGGVMLGSINMAGERILGVGGPTIAGDALRYGNAEIRNAEIAAAAAIAYSKLNLTGGILNADINAAAGIALTKLADWDKQSFTNLLHNGDFEISDPPANWTKVGGGATVSRSSLQAKIGTYSALLTRVGNDCTIYQSIPSYADYKGRAVTLGCWVYATVASRAFLRITDGNGAATDSAFHTGVAGWEWLTVTHIVDVAAAHLRTTLRIHTGDTSAYFDGAMLVEGSICPAFSPKPKQVATGTYTGNNANDRQITTGFKCSMVVVLSPDESYYTGIILAGFSIRLDSGAEQPNYLHASDGFNVYKDYLNATGSVYTYWAISE